MKYSYKNISGSEAETLLPGFNNENDSRYLDIATISKCRIANTYSADITVDVYLERDIDYDVIEPADDSGQFYSVDTSTFYFIKSLVIPTGAAIDIFDGNSCAFERKFKLQIKLNGSSETADITLGYSIDKNYNTAYSSERTRQVSRQTDLRQY